MTASIYRRQYEFLARGSEKIFTHPHQVIFARADTISRQINFVFFYCIFVLMKIEEAIVYCLASSGRGMKTDQIADTINRKRLHIRKDGKPVTSEQVYAVVMRYPSTFTKAEGRIMLII